jgi:ferredoxin-thioredoxin reductase catalytic subunit
MSSEVSSEVSDIEINIVEMAEKNGWKVSSNLERIAKAKNRFFGLAEWHRCPCYPPSDTIHGCGTEACGKQIEDDGKCHCNLYLKG